ncbi:SusC/RagA family TonB-linked outer membrane protein [Niastella yeongjuensis]|uniref:SusC/RagA family TonB-linked outer membrane protein n=1 Tax=Niastella yeongjuensis TaxID=354355 RepID=A0A1V9E1I1_9BACT|nr:TonB-dependent receptor [Niastella yeongjuensis]OQP39939.1 SusC/RagA family TonB-linked outer membrane protein [Niastella yeongjuensis]SEO10915.1 TonB-linked outer membrane protein, SusC/RagA family [Niastella yeongjuensis]
MKKVLVNQLIYRFMRIGLLPLLLITGFAGMMYARPVHGQEVLNQRINLVADNKDVKTVLNEISRLTDLKFVYSSQRIPVRQKISVAARNERLGDVLEVCLSPLNVLYFVSGNQIVLMRKGEAYNVAMLITDDPRKLLLEEEAPAKTITGKVTDESGDPLNGVSVIVRGTNRGTSTNEKGVFVITADAGETLSFTMVGYKESTVKVGSETNMAVRLVSETSNMNEVIIVGYGTQRRSSLTGAISSINTKAINELPVASVEQALQGRVAGLTVTNNGEPGTSPIVRIRGVSSINFASDPLYVIDGFPTSNLVNFDNRDIESVEVLKDASAAAIYGSRATNGVVLITTKKGRRDRKLKVTLDSYVGTQSPWKKIDLLNTEQYLKYERALNGAANIDLPPRLQSANFNQPLYTGTNQTYAQTNTDWQDAYFKSGVLTQHNLGVSGGNDISRFYTSAGYFKQDGISQAVYYERGNYRINSEHRISNVFSFGENLFLSYSKQRYDNTTGNRTRLMNVIRGLPYLPVYDPTTNGGFRNAENSVDGADPTNPVEDAVLLGNAVRKTLKVLGTAYADVTFTPWLKFRSTFGADHVNLYQHQFKPIYNDKGRSDPLATIDDVRTSITTLLFTQQLTVDKNFGNHHVTVTGVYETQSAKSFGEQMIGNQATNDVETMLGATNVSAFSTKSENLLISYVGRLNYEYAGKYMLSAAIRRDGLSVWAPGKKFANFPSASVGWRIDQEEFMRNIKGISELKLRGGYGETGLNGIGIFGRLPNSQLFNDYPWQAIVSLNGAVYPFNNTMPAGGNASYYNAISNLDLEWEKTKQLNIGVDLGLFNNRIAISADYYRRKTDNLMLSVPTPGSFGFSRTGVLANVGAMDNNGLDLQLTYKKPAGDFKWDITGNISFITNKVVSLNTPNATIDQGGDQDFGGGAPITRTKAGEEIQSFYGYIVDGIFQSDAEVTSSPFQTDKTKAGDLKFRDIGGPDGKPDGVITADDRTFLGNYIPDFTYSLNYTANYKNFDASVFFQGVQGNQIFNAARIISEGMARLFGSGTEVLNAWTPGNTGTNVPRAISGDPNQNVRPSTRWIENGSYLRLKNIMIGYTVPAGFLQSFTKGTVSSFRLYVSSQNLFTITKYKGWDPEIGSKNTTLTNGIDYGQYPVARSFQFGLQVGF